MAKISVEEVGENLPAILEQVARGEEVILVQQGKIVARVVPPLTEEQWLASRKQLRDSLQVKGEPLSETVIKLRQEERY
jgi:antitoxin (DNA-binding transcriptional repressor) of toxin-antitoxin stability system